MIIKVILLSKKEMDDYDYIIEPFLSEKVSNDQVIYTSHPPIKELLSCYLLVKLPKVSEKLRWDLNKFNDGFCRKIELVVGDKSFEIMNSEFFSLQSEFLFQGNFMEGKKSISSEEELTLHSPQFIKILEEFHKLKIDYLPKVSLKYTFNFNYKKFLGGEDHISEFQIMDIPVLMGKYKTSGK